MFVIYFNTLQTINILNLINHIICKSFDTHDCQNIVRGRVSVHNIVTLLNKITFNYRNMLTFRDHIFHWLQHFISWLNCNAPFIFIITPKPNIAIDLSNNSMIFRTPRLKQLGNSGQTSCNILGFSTFPRNSSNNVTSFYF